MIKELVTDEALLSTPASLRPLGDIAVATDLTDTLAGLENAGCLAANQIGVTRALFAFEDEVGHGARDWPTPRCSLVWAPIRWRSPALRTRVSPE